MKKTGKKILAGFGLSLILGSGLTAQNSSYNGNPLSVTGADNYAYGINSLNATTTGGYNSAFGRWSLVSNTTGHHNVAFGNSSLGFNTSGYENTACGYGANGASTSSYGNSSLGYFALANTTTGYNNCAFGTNSLFYNTIGHSNSAFGSGALSSNQNGQENIAVGMSALAYNLNGSYNTVSGTGAMLSNTGGSNNTAYGYHTLWSNVSGHYNTGVGCEANVILGSYNTVMGHQAIVNNGWYNTAIGKSALIGAGSYNCIALGDGSTVDPNLGNATAIGSNAIVTVSNRIWLGNAIAQIWAGIGPGLLIAPSDQRFKFNIKEDDVKGLDFIKLLRPVVYNFDAKKLTEHMVKNIPDSLRKNYLNEDFDKATAIRQTGFIAQEVELAAKKSGYDFNGVHTPENENDTYGLAYSSFVVPLVKGMQEQQQMIETLQQQVKEQKQLIDGLQNKSGSATGTAQIQNSETGFSLDQNIPNPFSNETVIKYTLTEQTKTATLNVYDLSGKQITSFPLTEKGTSSITITSEKLAAGIYIYSIVADGKIMDSKRMVVAEK